MIVRDQNKRKLRRLTSTVAHNGFGHLLHEFNLLHGLPFAQYRKRGTFIGHTADAQSLARMLEELGPGFVEVGKIVASRSDLIPQQYQNALLNNNTSIKPMSEKKFRQILRFELGRGIEKEITKIDAEPYRTNLISQTNKAILEDGRRVLITANNPKAVIELTQSVATIEWLNNWALPQVAANERGLWESAWKEFEQRALLLIDLKQVAGRIEILSASYEDNAKMNIPDVLWEYCTANVLVQDWQNKPYLKEISKQGIRSGVAKKYVTRYLLESMVSQYGISGVFVLRPSMRDIQLIEKNGIIMNHLLGTGILEPDERKRFVAMLYALVIGEPQLAGKVLLASHYENASRDRYFAAGLAIPNKKQAPVSELIWELLEYGWHGNLHIPLGYSMGAESILYLENAIAKFDKDVNVSDGLKSAIAKLVPEVFGLKKSATIEEVVKSVTTS